MAKSTTNDSETPTARREREQQRHEAMVMENSIAHKVIGILGRPPKFLRCVAKHIYKNTYRVNVFCSSAITTETGFDMSNISAKIAYSYLVTCPKDGTISSDPPLLPYCHN